MGRVCVWILRELHVKIKSVQSFECVHRGRVCIWVLQELHVKESIEVEVKLFGVTGRYILI
jgi:hypothetical protein